MTAAYPANPLGEFAGKLPQTSWSVAQSYADPGERADSRDLMAARLTTGFTDLTLDGDVLYGRPRGSVGYVARVDGPRLAEWARAELPAWQHTDLDAAAWAEVARLLAAWVRDRDAAAAAAMPADAVRAAELAAERARTDRRAELERQAADAAAELGRLDAGEPAEPEQPRAGGWLRRGPLAR